MGIKFWGGAALLTSLAASVGVACAADLAVKAPVYKAPPPVILSDWSGFYLGLDGGGGWANATFNNWDNFFDSDFSSQKAKPQGGLFGGHAGYNWQFGSIVTGVEFDFDAANISGTATDPSQPAFNVTLKTDELATARGRLGYTVLPNLLAYGSAGGAWSHSTLNTSFNTTSDLITPFGWVAGAGLEYKFYGNWIARAEYLHYDFGTTTFANFGFPTTETIDVVRGGISYKF
jgi:opacity protein-like surface antigen